MKYDLATIEHLYWKEVNFLFIFDSIETIRDVKHTTVFVRGRKDVVPFNYCDLNRVSQGRFVLMATFFPIKTQKPAVRSNMGQETPIEEDIPREHETS